MKPNNAFESPSPQPRDDPMEWLRRGPIGHHLLVSGYVLIVAPSVYALYLATKHQWVECVAIGASWLLLFPVVATWLHRHRLVHIGVSMTAMAAVVIALPLVLLEVE